jgi:uncharacterized RDD family membrane protein YckC
MDWYYREDSGLQVGPLTEDEFDGRVKAGQVTAETMVWNENMHGWQSYNDWQRASSSALNSLPDAPPIPKVVCSSCYRQFPENEVLRFQDSWVCASCKPLFFQRLKEGGTVPGILEYASFWPRFGAKIIDGIITNVASGIIQFGAIIPLTMVSKNESLLGVVYVISYLLALGMNFAYYVYFLTKHQATPGKMALGLKVVTPEGTPITAGTATGRFFAEILSGLICGVGYIMAAFDEEKRALHDRLCNTRVVRK